MVAAGSVVAAVQGLYLKSIDASFSSQNLTNMLSQVIGSDPVCRHILMQLENLTHWFVIRIHPKLCVFRRTACGPVKSRSSLSWSPACGRLRATAAAQNQNVRLLMQTCPAPQRMWETLTSETADKPRCVTDPQQKGVKVVTGVKASTAGTSSKGCWCQCRWKRHVLQDCPREKQWQPLTSVGSSWHWNISLCTLLL